MPGALLCLYNTGQAMFEDAAGNFLIHKPVLFFVEGRRSFGGSEQPASGVLCPSRQVCS